MAMFVYRRTADGEISLRDKYTDIPADSVEEARKEVNRMGLGKGELMVPETLIDGHLRLQLSHLQVVGGKDAPEARQAEPGTIEGHRVDDTNAVLNRKGERHYDRFPHGGADCA